MLLEVLRPKDNSVVMNTHSCSCISSEEIDSLSSSGYRFRLDGKVVSKQFVKQTIDVETENIKDASSINEELNLNKLRIVRCVTTGETFKNQSLAAKAYDIDPAQVSDSIKTGRLRSGYVFEYCYVDKEE